VTTELPTAALSRGRLTQTLAAREPGHGGLAPDHDRPLRIEHREALIYTLCKAAELEHLIICQYLFAAASLKKDASEGLAESLVPTVRGWAKTLYRIAEQEMLHLALVQNLLTAIGAGPHFSRPNFPVPPRAFPARIQIALLPFGEDALRHFAFLERPEVGFTGEPEVVDSEMFAAMQQAWPLPEEGDDMIGPIVADFSTISHLYRSIEDGLESLAARLGEDRLFIGPRSAQATGEHFRFPELIAVVDLASARAAIETIVEQGEGARGEWKASHFGRLMTMLSEFVATSAADPSFAPTRAVVPAYVRAPESGTPVALITNDFSVRVVDLLSASYEVALQVLARYFNHTSETDEQIAALADVAFFLMESVISPLGELAATLPVGPGHPGATCGPAYELFYDADWLLPHKEAAWQIIGERLTELAEFAASCRDECPAKVIDELSTITDKLREQAARINTAAAAARPSPA
jgi:hypothetical protein